MKRAGTAVVALVLASGVHGGCTEPNAILELRVDLPPAPDGEPRRPHALTQVRIAEEARFDAVWQDSGDVQPILLDDTERTVDHISVELVGEDDDHDLAVRVRFCQDPGCAAIADDVTDTPSVCAIIEHPFYVGKRTFVTLVAGAFPDARCTGSDIFIDKCSVRGCVSGDESEYCRVEDGSHFCE